MLFCISTGLILAILGLISWSRIWHWSPRSEEFKTYCFFTPIPAILIPIGVYFATYHHIAFFNEIWNAKIQKVIYYEAWTERYTTTETDSKGNSRTVTRYRHHPPDWRAEDEYGTEHPISSSDYSKWRDIWKNEKEVDILRLDQSSWGDGDKYESYWDQRFDSLMPVSFVTTYENKIRATNTVWSFVPVDKETKKKFPRPADTDDLCPIMSYGVHYPEFYKLHLRRWNAVLGREYEIHNVLILFDAATYPDRSAMETVINAWMGPNKNELITLVGVNTATQEIVWCDVFSWMDDTKIHSLLRQDISSLPKFECGKVIDLIVKNVKSNWHRKSFSDFDYIKVPIPTFAYVIILLVGAGVSVGMGFLSEQKGSDIAWKVGY